ncbi:MAG: endonuclease [Rhodobacterales bacterium 17-64-5]|nr:MAG: endonuclease [Rhodobacterales bacterium 17-64-5]
MLKALTAADDPQTEQDIAVILRLDADILLLTNVDFDAEGAGLAALSQRLAAKGLTYADVLALRPNTGIATGLDLNHDGALSGPRDAQAYGRFAGQGGMAILSRYPIDRGQIRDFTALLWRDLPDADLPPDMTPEAQAVQRLSTDGHYEVPVTYAPDKTLRLLVWAATPPVFDGPEDRNGRRNADETALWLHLLDGTLPQTPPAPPFVLLGRANLDPADGDGKPQALRSLLALPDLQDPAPRGSSGHTDPGHKGDPAHDTAVLKSGAGLRLDYILPSRDITVTGSGVLWLPDTDPFAATLAGASTHRPVWARLNLP